MRDMEVFSEFGVCLCLLLVTNRESFGFIQETLFTLNIFVEMWILLLCKSPPLDG